MPILQALLTVLAAILWLAGPAAYGESYTFRTYQRPDGLENLNIHCMLQEHKGQLLFCTENGVYLFDGARMRRVPSFEDHDLPFIQAMGEDRANRVWVANMHELIYLDAAGVHRPGLPRFGTQRVAENRIAIFPRDQDQLYLMADRQVYRVSSRDHGAHWSQAPVFDDAATRAHPELKLASDLVAVPSPSGESAGGTLWMGCGRHLCSASATGDHLRVWGVEQGVPEDDWRTIFQDHRGRLWARSNSQVVALLPGDSKFVSEEHGLTAKSLYMSYPTIIEDAQGRVLLNLSAGLARLEDDHWHVFGKQNSLPEGWIGSMLADRQGSMWFSVIGHGLMRWIGYGNWERWKDRDGLVGEVWGMAEGPKGSMWVATDTDLMRVPSGDERRAEPQASGSPFLQVFAVAVDHSGRVWLGDNTGLVRIYDPATHQVRLLPMEFKDVSSFLVGPDGAVWVCSAKGLYRFDEQAGYQTVSHEAHEAPILAGEFYHAGYAKGMYYFVGDRGLFSLTPTGTLTEVKMPAGITFVLDGPSTVAPDGTLWMQGEGSPLIHLRIHGSVAELVERVGPPQVVSPSVYQISFDQRGWMWVGTDRGVDVFNGHEWTGLTTEDGLVWDDTDTLAFYPAADGSVWIGTSGGLSHILHPERLFERQPLTVEVNNARIGGTPLLAGQTTKVPWRARGSLTVQLGVSNPSRASEMRYRFRMDRLENEWQDTDEHQLRYSALPPGSYRLAVMAVDPRRHQESAPVYIEFRLLPPWYRTNWFLCLLALTLACLVGVACWWRVSALMAQQLRLEELVQERTQQLELEKKELIEARLALVEQASRDGLTGLLNRSAIFEVLTTELIHANEKNAPLAIVLADLDHFKRINDTYGHQVGDAVLRECARRFNLATRPTDYVGRYGGEELLLVMPGLSQENSAERLESLRATIAHELFDCDGIGLPVTCSFGVAWIDDHVRSIKPLIALADQALYAAKTRGRNRVETVASSNSGQFFPDGSGPLVITR